MARNRMQWVRMQMPDHDPDSINNKKPVQDDDLSPGISSRMTLEDIIDLTGELEHLNELVLLHIGKDGGITGPESYFCKVQPILDLLEIEIRIRYRAGMSCQDLKLIVQDWIDKEIAGQKK